MLTLELFTWWFSSGWRQVIKNVGRATTRISDVFSVPILLRTLASPWRRIITYPGASIDAKLRAYADNLVSRCIGFTVRCLVLLTAGILLLLVLLLGLMSIVVWPLVPFLIIGLLIRGLMP